jgi:hypothetical protein
MTQLVTEKVASEATSITARTLREWRRRKLIPFFKIQRSARYDLDALFAALEKFKRN